MEGRECLRLGGPGAQSAVDGGGDAMPDGVPALTSSFCPIVNDFSLSRPQKALTPLNRTSAHASSVPASINFNDTSTLPTAVGPLSGTIVSDVDASNLPPHQGVHPALVATTTRTKRKSKIQCDICQEKFTSEESFCLHRMQVHGPGAAAKSFQCDMCGRGFAHKRNMLAHRRTCTGAGHKILCLKCGLHFQSASAWHRHQKTTDHTEFVLTPGTSAADGSSPQDVTKPTALPIGRVKQLRTDCDDVPNLIADVLYAEWVSRSDLAVSGRSLDVEITVTVEDLIMEFGDALVAAVQDIPASSGAPEGTTPL